METLAVTIEEHKHLLLDVWVEEAAILERVAPWREILRGAAERMEATIIAERFHQFEPHGVTGFLLLAESHISVHTWPEENFAAIDIFFCGPMDTDSVVGWLETQLAVRSKRVRVMMRGDIA